MRASWRPLTGLLALLLLAAGAWLLWQRPVLAPLELTAPAPAARPLPVMVPQVRDSVLHLPVEVSIEALQTRLEQAAPRQLSGREDNPLGALSDDRLDWQAERGPIALAGRPDGLYLQVAAVGQARVKGKARILVEIPVSARADLAATLTARLQPQLRPDWTLAPNLVGMVQVQRAEVPIQGLGRVSLREQVQGPANQAAQGLLRRLEQRLGRDQQLRNLAQREWARLHQVQKVSEGPPAWLMSQLSGLSNSTTILRMFTPLLA